MNALPEFFCEKEKINYDPIRFQAVSPAGDRAWVMLWVAVDREGCHWVYREWPTLDEDGAWAERRDGKWVLADTAKTLCYGLSFKQIADTIKELEDGEEIRARIMPDSQDDFWVRMSDFKLWYSRPFVDAGRQEALQSVHDLIAIPKDRGDKPKEKDEEKQRLRILPCCGNLLAALPGYDPEPGQSGDNHAWRPWIECLEMIAVSNLGTLAKFYSTRKIMGSKGGGY